MTNKVIPTPDNYNRCSIINIHLLVYFNLINISSWRPTKFLLVLSHVSRGADLEPWTIDGSLRGGQSLHFPRIGSETVSPHFVPFKHDNKILFFPPCFLYLYISFYWSLLSSALCLITALIPAEKDNKRSQKEGKFFFNPQKTLFNLIIYRFCLRCRAATICRHDRRAGTRHSPSHTQTPWILPASSSRTSSASSWRYVPLSADFGPGIIAVLSLYWDSFGRNKIFEWRIFC